MVRNLAAQPGRSSWADRSRARAPGATFFVITLPEPGRVLVLAFGIALLVALRRRR